MNRHIIVIDSSIAGLEIAREIFYRFPGVRITVISPRKLLTPATRQSLAGVPFKEHTFDAGDAFGSLCSDLKSAIKDQHQIYILGSAVLVKTNTKQQNLVLFSIDTGREILLPYDQLLAPFKGSEGIVWKEVTSEHVDRGHGFRLEERFVAAGSLENEEQNVLSSGIGLFTRLHIETSSFCNRSCNTCLRQNDSSQSRFQKGEPIVEYMTETLIQTILDQAVEMGFRGDLCLQFYNEPLYDSRMPKIARYAREKGFESIYIHTNGDLLDENIARSLDGFVDFIIVSLYDHSLSFDQMKKREMMLARLFDKTRLAAHPGKHMTTHFSPKRNLAELITKKKDTVCLSGCWYRCIISYSGEMVLCCEDLSGAWNLGNIRDKSLSDLWFGEKHQTVLKTLSKPGGRSTYALCRECPI